MAIVQVLEVVLRVLNDPETVMEHQFGYEAAALLRKDRQQFFRQAQTMAREHALQRPDAPASPETE